MSAFASSPERLSDDTDPERAVANGVRSAADEQRIVSCIEQHFAAVWRSLRRFGVPESGADDAAQHVFWLFSERLTQVELGRERSFLLGVAVRVAANVRRLHERSRETPGEDLERARDSGADPESLLEQKQRRQRLDQALATLPAEQRHVFVLYELEGFSLPEIAHTLAIPLGTATSRLRRARAAFELWVDSHFPTTGTP